MAKKILIVDDSVSTRKLLKISITKMGFIAVEAQNGETAVSYLETMKDIDVIVTDINMPGMSGIDLVKAIRRIDGYKFSPVLIMTNPENSESLEKAKTAGATAWIDKPFKPGELIRIINKVSKK